MEEKSYNVDERFAKKVPVCEEPEGNAEESQVQDKAVQSGLIVSEEFFCRDRSQTGS